MLGFLTIFSLNRNFPHPTPDLTGLRAWMPVVAAAPPPAAQPRAGNSPAVENSSSCQWLGFSYCPKPLRGEMMWPLPHGGPRLTDSFPLQPKTREVEGSHAPCPRWAHISETEVTGQDYGYRFLLTQLGLLHPPHLSCLHISFTSPEACDLPPAPTPPPPGSQGRSPTFTIDATICVLPHPSSCRPPLAWDSSWSSLRH